MATFQKFNVTAQDIGRKVHNLHTDVLKVLLTNTAPVATNAVKADLTEIAAGNGYAAGGPTLANQSYAQTGATGKLTADDIRITATGGSIGPLRYAALYNDTATNDPLLGWWEYPGGASITLLDGEYLDIDFDPSAGILTI